MSSRGRGGFIGGNLLAALRGQGFARIRAVDIKPFEELYQRFDDCGREKAPASICRKATAAKVSGKHEIEIWGSGEQTRSFMYIGDCINSIQLIMDSEIIESINLGSSEAASTNQLVDVVEETAAIKLKRKYDLSAPQGVNGRNSDNTVIRKYSNWEPNIPLRTGLEKTYPGYTTNIWLGGGANP